TCRHQLKANELIPVISYVIQRGKCRNCKTRISPIYPIMELLTGIMFAASLYFIGWSGELVIALTLVSLFIIITVSDIYYMIIPDRILLWFAGIFLIERIIWPLTPWWDSLLGMIFGFLLLFVIALLSNGGMGFGDVKLFAVIGFVLGVKLVILSLFFSTLIGAVVGSLAIVYKIVKKRQPIPFGPFIAMGTFVAYFFGRDIIEIYFEFLNKG
ncbi:A24 family peptidase, partial [Bacillus xiapuensis]|nr:A24 family peptidase [Bacillus xiapuensis]